MVCGGVRSWTPTAVGVYTLQVSLTLPHDATAAPITWVCGAASQCDGATAMEKLRIVILGFGIS
jgi:hypothetical protein